MRAGRRADEGQGARKAIKMPPGADTADNDGPFSAKRARGFFFFRYFSYFSPRGRFRAALILQDAARYRLFGRARQASCHADLAFSLAIPAFDS